MAATRKASKGRTGKAPEALSAKQSGFVGRDPELERLRAAFQTVLNGSGRLVLLAGEPGIGKTRLAEELAREASERGASVAWGRCWEEDGAPDLWPWLQVIRTCLRSVDDDTLRDLVGAHGSELTLLVASMRVRRSEPPLPSETPAARFRVFNAITHFLEAYAERTPLVVILDDLHRADPSSLLLLQFFTQEQRQRRILTIGIYREPGAPANRALTQMVVESMRAPGTERFALGELLATQSADLMKIFLPEPPAELVQQLWVRTGGNPLYITECARQLHTRAAGGLPLSSTSSADLPPTAELHELIEQRLAPLCAANREVLRQAATLGRDFERPALEAHLASVPDRHEADCAEVSATLDEAEKLGLVVRGTVPGAYRFGQEMLRELLLDELPRGQRPPPQLPAESPQREVASPVPASDSPAEGTACVFRREGEYWTITFAGSTSRVRDAKGLAYLALLLRYPRRPIHVSELLQLGETPAEAEPQPGRSDDSVVVRVGLGDAGPVLDAQAKADYRRRLGDLREELRQALEFNDTGKGENLQKEIDFLTQELLSAVGLSGRDRRSGSGAERARVNVTRSIVRAIEKMSDVHPRLARYLRDTVRTGTFCTYVPDGTVATDWEL
jgi:DNA polymerase III delta prime subunit